MNKKRFIVKTVMVIVIYCLVMNCKTSTQLSSKWDFLGATVPYAIDKEKQPVQLGLIPHARIFCLDLDSRRMKKYLRMLQESQESDTPVRIYLFSGTPNIGKITKASPEEIERYNNAKIPPGEKTED